MLNESFPLGHWLGVILRTAGKVARLKEHREHPDSWDLNTKPTWVIPPHPKTKAAIETHVKCHQEKTGI